MPPLFKCLLTVKGVGSSINQITSGQVVEQLSFSFTLLFTFIEAQFSQLQEQKCWLVKNYDIKDISACIVNVHLLPDGDICKFFWRNSDAL